MKYAFAAALVLMGCYTEDNYPDTVAKQGCKRYKECERADFDNDYTSLGDCTEETAHDLRDFQDCYIDAGCEYDAEQAKICSKALRTESCEDWSEGAANNDCDELYNCSDREYLDVVACLMGF